MYIFLSLCRPPHTPPLRARRTLNFNNEPMYLGGVMTVDPLQERPQQVFADDFIGCVQAVSINGRPLNLSGPIQVSLAHARTHCLFLRILT